MHIAQICSYLKYPALFSFLHLWYDVNICLFIILKEAGVLPNLVICKILLKRSALSFSFKLLICETMKKLEVYPDKEFLSIVEQSIINAEQLIVRQVNKTKYSKLVF